MPGPGVFFLLIRKYVLSALTSRRQLMDSFLHNHHWLLLRIKYHYFPSIRVKVSSSNAYIHCREIIVYVNGPCPDALL